MFYHFGSLVSNLSEAIDMSIDTANVVLRSVMTKAVNDIADTARANLTSKIQGANNKLKEGGTLYAGIRCFTWKNVPAATVHIYGNRNNDGTWRLRFFEGGTKDRYQRKDKTKSKRQKGNKGRYTGRIEPTWFFNDAVKAYNTSALMSTAEQRLGRSLKQIEDSFKI